MTTSKFSIKTIYFLIKKKDNYLLKKLDYELGKLNYYY